MEERNPVEELARLVMHAAQEPLDRITGGDYTSEQQRRMASLVEFVLDRDVDILRRLGRL